MGLVGSSSEDEAIFVVSFGISMDRTPHRPDGRTYRTRRAPESNERTHKTHKPWKMQPQRLVSDLVFLLALVSLVAVHACGLQAAADTFVGCGGFVREASSSSTTADLSRVRVFLRVSDASGLVRESTSCAPSGYFFIPMEASQHGQYAITAEAPDGWTLGTFI